VDASVRLRTGPVRSPFSVTKRGSIDGPTVSVAETVTNTGAVPIDVMWSQHPALGAPLVGPQTRVEVAAATVHTTDLAAGAWPTLPATGEDLRRLAGPR